jgi:hypothetical protein
MARGPVLVPLVIAALAAGVAPAAAQDASQDAGGGVAASNGVVIHGVDTKMIAARLREADRKAASGDAKGAAAELGEVLLGDVSPLVEDGENAYLSVLEAALQRLATLPPEGLAAYRATADVRAEKLLASALARSDAGALARAAPPLVLTTHGPRLFVALADLRAAHGDADGAAQALGDLLRSWPDASVEMPGVDRADVVARLAALYASLGDENSVRYLLRETPATLLDGPSPLAADAKLRDELMRCVRAAAASGRGAAARPSGPAAAVEATAIRVFSSEPLDLPMAREIPESAIPIGTPDRPVLLTREPAAGASGNVVALTPLPGALGSGPAPLVPVWQFPSKQEVQAGLRRTGHGEFEPARAGDVLLYAWPAVPSAQDGAQFEEDERSTLIAQSIAGEGRLIDERGGDDELKRDDPDPSLVPGADEDHRAALSFCGRPLVVGNSVYTTLVRRTDNGGATELHVARFDLVQFGRAPRLVRRWRRHVVDGNAMPRVMYPSDSREGQNQVAEPLAVPAAMAERYGRIYVTSNTGAVACLDADDGRPMWVQAYPRFGPPQRHQTVPTIQKTWKDVPVMVDGPFVWTAPRDAEYLLQFRAMPRAARTTLVESWRFQGTGTSTESSPLLANVVPDEVVGVSMGVGWFAGVVPGRRVAGLVPSGRPLASLRMRVAQEGEPRRATAYAQIPEDGASGSPFLAKDAIFFPTYKAIYRVPLGDFESAPMMLWKTVAARQTGDLADEIGNLVADGNRLWSVTPRRVLLLSESK